MSLETDIDAMLSGLDPVTVVHQGNTSQGAQDLVDKDMVGGSVTAALGELRGVLIRTSAFPGLKTDDALTVDGIAYTVLDRKRIDDGHLTLIVLGNP